MINYAVCVPKSLAPEKLVAAAAIAAEINPVNHPPLYRWRPSCRAFRSPANA